MILKTWEPIIRDYVFLLKNIHLQICRSLLEVQVSNIYYFELNQHDFCHRRKWNWFETISIHKVIVVFIIFYSVCLSIPISCLCMFFMLFHFLIFFYIIWYWANMKDLKFLNIFKIDPQIYLFVEPIILCTSYYWWKSKNIILFMFYLVVYRDGTIICYFYFLIFFSFFFLEWKAYF